MNKHIIFFALSAIFLPSLADAAATCSRANLTRCLDSVCAINVNSNPAARCQYCGTSSAGEPPKSKSMKSVSVGQSSKNTLSEKELKAAPTDPGQRYAWATAQCIAKLGGGCTPDDVSDAYDSLIEQSCTAAGISAQMSSLQADLKKTKSQSSCNTDITSCLVAANRCGPDYAACQSDADFDNFFAACSVEATGCDQYMSAIRTELFNSRNDAIANAAEAPKKIAESYQAARNKKRTSIQSTCADNASRDQCVETVCQNNMRNKCATSSEKSNAILLCKFYEVACTTIKDWINE